MKCYLCLIASPSITSLACALCQRCGAAICERHLVSLLSPVGMAGGRRYTLVCSQCRATTPSPLDEHSRQSRCQQNTAHPERFVGWFWFARRKRTEGLPESSSVIAAVEQLLKERRQH